MDPVTHLLASATVARAGLKRLTPLAMPMALAAGLVPDIDLLSLLGGAGAYIGVHRGPAHSLVGAAALGAAVAAAFWWFTRKRGERGAQLKPAVIVCIVSAWLHVSMDAMNPHGVKLWWPARDRFVTLDWMETIDPITLIILLMGLLLPALFRLVTEEIGARVERRGPQRGAIVALALLTMYCGARYALHDRALQMLASHVYHNAEPRGVAAFPTGFSPLLWRGLAETDNSIEEIEVKLTPGAYFNSDNSRTHYKPEESPAIDAARATPTVQAFLKYARYPKASIEKLPNDAGFRVEVRDLRFEIEAVERRDVIAVVEMNPKFEIILEELRFAGIRKD